MAFLPPACSMSFLFMYWPRATKITIGSTKVIRKLRSGFMVCSMVPENTAPASNSRWVSVESSSTAVR